MHMVSYCYRYFIVQFLWLVNYISICVGLQVYLTHPTLFKVLCVFPSACNSYQSRTRKLLGHYLHYLWLSRTLKTTDL